MKRINLLFALFAGLLLIGVPAFAQEGPVIDASRDAHKVFSESFGGSWDFRKNNIIDSITSIEYYNREGSGNFSNKNIYDGSWDWEIYGSRDTVISLAYSQVRPTGIPADEENFLYDSYYVTQASEWDIEALQQLGNYSADRIFNYFTGIAEGSQGYSNGSVPRYSRNLFFRGLNIEENSSYRLTLYVKANQWKATPLSSPVFYADVMRGCDHSEEPFVVDLDGVKSLIGYDGWTYTSVSLQPFEYTKNDFVNDQWDKVTFMTYYTNDSILNGYMYRNGYWWSEGDWTWNQDGVEHNYIKQPNSFLVRLSFATDSTAYSVSNISLTRSTIGGVDFCGNKLRVDFGYQTNLTELVRTALLTEGVAAVKVPAEYFEVWRQEPAQDTWKSVPIDWAEYHDDGYMYLFTKNDTLDYGGSDFVVPNWIGNTDKVLVTFHNPVEDESMCLKYTGNLYPNSLDKEWIASGKPVLDFYNEEASYNEYAFKNVYSLNDLPPVLQYTAIENGSFGLDQNIRGMRFKFSKPIEFDDMGASSKLALVKLQKNDVVEYWRVVSSDANGFTYIERPAEYTSQLKGDYVLTISQIKNATTDYGEDVVLIYNFGKFNTNPVTEIVAQSDWRNEVDAEELNNNRRPIPTSLYLHSEMDMFQIGTGQGNGNKCGLYPVGKENDCMFYLSARSSNEKKTGNLYTIQNLDAGQYIISFKAIGWSVYGLTDYLYIYAKPEGELLDGNNNGFDILNNVSDKELIGEFRPFVAVTSMNSNSDWPSGTQTYELQFRVENKGDYVLEWVVPSNSNSSTSGAAIGNYTIIKVDDISAGPVLKLNKAVLKAQEMINSLPENRYGGIEYDTLANVIANAQVFVGNHANDYDMIIWEIDGAVEKLQNRVEHVNGLLSIINNANQELAKYMDYSVTDVYRRLSGTCDSLMAANYSYLSWDDINEAKQKVCNGIEALVARVVLIDRLNKLRDKTAILIKLAEKEQSQEYIKLSQEYELYGALDYMNISDEDLLKKAKYYLSDALYNYQGIFVRTKRLNDLYDLAADLGSEVVNIPAVKASLASALTDDEQLAGLLKSAVKVAVYEHIAGGSSVDTLNLTPFFKNYNLYATPKVVDRSGYVMPTNKSILSEPDPDGAQIQLVQHQWNSGDLNGHQPIWIMIPGQTYYDLYPGWEAISYSSSSQCMANPDVDRDYSNFSNGVPVFDGTLAMDWNSNAALTTVLQDLPAGEYTLGVEILENTSSNTYLTANTIFDTYTIHAATDWFGETTINGINVTNGELSVTLDLMSGSGWSRADNFSLIYTNPSYDFDYSLGLADAKAELNNALVALGYSQVEPIDPFEELRYILYNAIDSASCTLGRASDNSYRGSDYSHLQSVIFDVQENNSLYKTEDQFYAVIDSLSYYSFLLSERIYIVNNAISALDAANEELKYYSEFSYLENYSYLRQIYSKYAKHDFRSLSYQELVDLIGVIYDTIYDLEEAIANIDNPEEPEEYGFYMDDIYCESGSNVVIPVKMRNDKPVVGFSLDVKLPYGMSFVSAELDKYRSNGHKLSVNVSAEWAYEVVSLACLSSENDTIIGSDSTVIYLTVNVPAELSGNYTVLLTNSEMTFDALSYCIPDDYEGLVAVFQSYVLPGDVNSDERISITDAVGIINFIINADTKDLNRRAADANQDGLIDAADVVYVVNIVIHKNNTQSRSSGLRTITSSLSMDDVNTNGSGFSLPVSLNGMQNEITAIQFNMDLPDDIVLNGIKTDNTHIAAYQQQADGSYTVVCVSMSNSTFAGNGDAAMSLDLSAGREFDGGQVVLSNASLVTPDCLKATQDQVVFSLDKNTTGINGIGIDSDSEMFDVLGRVADDTNGIRIQGGQKSIRIK